MTNIEYFDKVHNKGSLGKRIWGGFDDTLSLPLETYLYELKKYLKRTREYKKAENKDEFLKDNLDYMEDYYILMNKAINKSKELEKLNNK
jgi:uncharacterized radical SAM superfamily protein